MHKTSIKQVAIIDSGKSFRKKPDIITSDGCWLIQMKDVSPEGLVQQPQSISLNEVSHGQLLNYGDLIFVAKGKYNYAVVYDREHPATAVSLFFIIRPNLKQVDPWYLAWFLNSKRGQQYFDKFRMGSSVGNIRKSVLENMEIVLPNLEKQHKVAKLSQLLQHERSLTEKYIEKRELLIDESINSILL